MCNSVIPCAASLVAPPIRPGVQRKLRGVLAGACCHHSQRNDCFCPSYHFPPRRRTSRHQGGASGKSRVSVEELHQCCESSDRYLANPHPSCHARAGGRTTFSILVCFRRHKKNLDGVRTCSVLDVNLEISTKENEAVARQTEVRVHEPIRVREQFCTRTVLKLGTTGSTTTPDLTTLRPLPPENS